MNKVVRLLRLYSITVREDSNGKDEEYRPLIG
nr:MAG TPA: hypothetical protein [Caudoviricetes sp.]